jgi:hypothetical protein
MQTVAGALGYRNFKNTVLPDAELKSIEGQKHAFSPKVLAPVTAEFVAGPVPAARSAR